MRDDVVACFSGGLDSTVLLWHLLRERGGTGVRAVSVHYGQRHSRELESARTIAGLAGVEHDVVDLSGLRPILRGSSQTDDSVDVPRGHYADPTMRATVVPNRNMLLLAVAGAAAAASGATAVAYAAHAGDHPVYPDCRPEFAEAVGQALGLCHYEPIRLERPFVTWSKADVARHGYELGAPLGDSWSCYDPTPDGDDLIHCGACGTCVERREAFELACVDDATTYSS